MAILDAVVAMVTVIAILIVEDHPLLVMAFAVVLALLIPIGFLRWKTQISESKPLAIWEKIFTITSVAGLAIAWFYAVLMSASVIDCFSHPISVNICY